MDGTCYMFFPVEAYLGQPEGKTDWAMLPRKFIKAPTQNKARYHISRRQGPVVETRPRARSTLSLYTAWSVPSYCGSNNADPALVSSMARCPLGTCGVQNPSSTYICGCHLHHSVAAGRDDQLISLVPLYVLGRPLPRRKNRTGSASYPRPAVKKRSQVENILWVYNVY